MSITNAKEFNMAHRDIRDVIETVTGRRVERIKGGYVRCPICNGDKGSVSRTGEFFQCMNHQCTEGGARAYRFLDVYFRKVEGITDFKEIRKRIDELFNTNLYKEFKKGKKKPKVVQKYTRVYEIDKYCGEIEIDFFNDLLKEKRILLKAGTGFGKSHMLAEGAKNLIECRALDVDKVIFATPRGSIVEEIEAHGYKTFYKNDVELPFEKCIATTTHKAPLLVQQLEEVAIEMGDGTIQWEGPKDYLLIIDEAHLLLSARGIVVKDSKDLRHLNTLIEKAKYIVFTSANTDHFYEACKDTYDIKSYINVTRKVPLYNLERLDVKRVNKDRDTRNKILIGDIKKEINNGNKVFMVHNNIKDLRFIKEALDAHGILTNVIYSANKTSEGVYNDYVALIKKSVLNCNVTLCTSVVDTGVNIHEKNVTTMLVQDQTSFDDITTIQTFARVRVPQNGFNGNKGILYLTDVKERQEKHDKILGVEGFLETYNKIARELAVAFNAHVNDNYDGESYECYKDVWNMLRGNELYHPHRHIISIKCKGDYNEEPLMVVDEIATYDKARRAYLTHNYFNDEFIKEITKEINTKEVRFIKDIREEDKKEKVDGETFQDVLLKFMEDSEYHQIISDRYIKEINTDEEPFYIGYLKSDYTRKFNKLDKRIKAMCNMIRRTKVDASQLGYSTDMIEAHALLSGKDLKKRLQQIEWPIYNMMYKERKSYEGLGDVYYIEIRRAFDKAVVNRNKLTDRAIQTFTEYYYANILKKWVYDKATKEYLVKTTNKSANVKKAMEDVMGDIANVYSISEKGYMILL